MKRFGEWILFQRGGSMRSLDSSAHIVIIEGGGVDQFKDG